MSDLIHRPVVSASAEHADRVTYIETPPTPRGEVYVDLAGAPTVEAFFGLEASHQHRAVWAFEAFVVPPLCDLMRRDFPDEKKLLVRGVTLNLGARFSFERGRMQIGVKTLGEVLQTGSELEKSQYLPDGGIVTEVLEMDPDDGTVPSYALSYLWLGVLDLRRLAPPEHRRHLFPALLVYDAGLGKHTSERPCGWQLPGQSDIAARAIRRAYVFDFFGPEE